MKETMKVFFAVSLVWVSSIGYSCPLPDGLDGEYAGSLIEFTGNPTPYSVAGQTVAIYPTANVCAPDGSAIAVRLLGYGLYAKPVGFIKVNVYVAASYADNVENIDPANPLPGLKASRASAVQMNMVRTASLQEIKSHFESTMDLNGVDLSEPHVADIYNQLASGVNLGESAVLVGTVAPNGDETLRIEMPTQNLAGEGPDLVQSFWKVWFGNSFIDSGMKTLKAAMLKFAGKPAEFL